MEVHANNFTMQMAWAREHRVSRIAKYGWRLSQSYLAMQWRHRGLEQIVLEQIRRFKPDVILAHDLDFGGHRFRCKLKRLTKLLVLQIACPLDWQKNFSAYDLVVTSLPSYVQRFNGMGIQARLLRLGFDPVILQHLPEVERDIDISFVGSISNAHSGRARWLEAVCRNLPVKVWGDGVDLLAADSAVRKAYQGTAWGIEMYEIMRRSKLTLNFHIDIAGNYANNLRLYEATGPGACLVTDWKPNLKEIFSVGGEVVAYKDEADCIAQLQSLLKDDPKRKAIAQAGQIRTLREHTYFHRMEQFVEIIQSQLAS